MRLCNIVAVLTGIGIAVGAAAVETVAVYKDTGYRGIWYSNQKVDTEYVYKYSGGLGTYCAKHIPMAVYAPEVNKTFFVFGGARPTERSLLISISYYDHETGMVPQPTVILDKNTTDAHDNPVIAIGPEGRIFVFASAHGTGPASYIYRSTEPYSIDGFEQLADFNYSYPQPWYIEGEGFLFMHTWYKGGRTIRYMTSKDGVEWSERQLLSAIDEGHYEITWPHDGKVGSAFNYHPQGKGLNWRTNLYYVETDDLGETWRNIQGETITPPLKDRDNPALAHDYEAEGLLAYMKDLKYDDQGRPIILHITSKGWEPGPDQGPHEWRVAHWTGESWDINVITDSDNNYDTGSLHIAEDGTWRVIGPMLEGPQRYNPGGEVAITESNNKGKTWTKPRAMTKDSVFNHTYVRRPLNAHPDFGAYWADGHGRQPSESRLYFSDEQGKNVYRLPFTMDSDMVKPERVILD